MTPPPRKAGRVGRLILLAALVGSGCARPDRSPTFEPHFDRALRSDVRPVPASLMTGSAHAPEFPGVDEGGVLELSVEDAAVLALQRNRDLQVEQLGPVLAGTFEVFERGVFDPELFASFRYKEERESEVSRSTSEQFSFKGDERFLEAGVRQRFPTGTEVAVSVEQDRESSNRAPEQERARLGLTVTQSLLRGLGSTVNLVRVRQAELGEVASRHELRAFTETLLSDVLIAYWTYVLAEREIAIFEESLSVAKQQLSEVQQRISVGVLPEAETASARVEVARREQALIEARSSAEDRRLRVLRLMSPPRAEGGLGLRLRPTTTLPSDAEPITDVDERIALALQQRPELGEARTLLLEDRLETILTRDGLLPRLEFFADLGRSGFSDTFPDSFRELDERTYDWQVGLRLSQYLGDRQASARDLAARTEVRTAQLAIENLEELVEFQVRLALNDVERARKLIGASRVTRELEAQVLTAEQERFAAGASTGILVAQAQRDLLVSQIAEVRALVEYRIALVRLHRAEGSLLERRGLGIADAL